MSNNAEPMNQPAATHPIAISADLTDCKYILREMIAALNAGPRTRYRALAITDLQSAVHWINDAQGEE